MNPNAILWDPDVLNGLRDSNWDLSAELQQELVQGLSMTVGYYFNNGGYNQQNDSKNRRTDNLAVSAADYSPYCVTAPSHPGLPGRRGQRDLRAVRPEPGQVRAGREHLHPDRQVRQATSGGITSST